MLRSGFPYSTQYQPHTCDAVPAQACYENTSMAASGENQQLENVGHIHTVSANAVFKRIMN
jgi:hypothetical protein